MDSNRQEAYRHLLYTVFLHFRSGTRHAVWWNPVSWWRAIREWRRNKVVANYFHNLALFSVHQFERFDESTFWQDIDRLGELLGSNLAGRYRRIFDEYLSGRAALT